MIGRRRGTAIAVGAALAGTALVAPAPAFASDTLVVASMSELQAAFADPPASGSVTVGFDWWWPFSSPAPLELAPGRELALDLTGHSLTIVTITLGAGSHLTIDDTDPGNEPGEILAQAGRGFAGIRTTDASLTVNAGSVIADGVNAAGIGGDAGQDGGTVTVHGGIVQAGAHDFDGTDGLGTGAGIGGGPGGDGGTLLVTGGEVTAWGEVDPAGSGAAVGGGAGGSGGDTSVTGGRLDLAVLDGSAYGPGDGGAGFGSLGILAPGTVTVGPGTTLTVPVGAAVTGDGELRAWPQPSATGRIVNEGAILLPADHVDWSVLGVAPNTHGVSFVDAYAPAPTPIAADRIFAASFDAAARAFPAPPSHGDATFRGWYTSPDGSGAPVTSATDLTALVGPGADLTLHAVYAKPAPTEPSRPTRAEIAAAAAALAVVLAPRIRALLARWR